MIVFQSMIKVKKKSFSRYIGVAKNFDWRRGLNRKSNVRTLLKFFEEGLLWDNDIVKWRIRSRGLGWHVTWILQKRKELNKKLKKFLKLSKLGDVDY